jgi:Sec-independent protein translocase protein TatA
VSVIVAALDNPIDLAFLLVFAFLLFGKQLPEVARSLGKGIRELREGTNFSEVTDALNSVNQIRSAVTPTAIARAALPGVAEVQDTVGAAKDLVNPGPAEAGEETEAPSEPTSPSGATAAPPLG